jgi:hypothetical protein
MSDQETRAGVLESGSGRPIVRWQDMPNNLTVDGNNYLRFSSCTYHGVAEPLLGGSRAFCMW